MSVVSRNDADKSSAENGASVQTYAQLMDLHDEVFVQAAYLTVLRRPADSIGLGYYVKRLRAGHSRLAVLDQLAKSPECGDDLPRPIWDAIERFRASRKLVGWRTTLKDPELGRTRGLRQARILQNNMAAHRQQIEELFVRLSRQQDIIKDMIDSLPTASPRETSGERTSRDEDVVETDLHLRGRRVEDVRTSDLSRAAKDVLDGLRF